MLQISKKIIFTIGILMLLSSTAYAEDYYYSNETNFDFYEGRYEWGYSPWNHADNLAARDGWLSGVGETPDYYENFETGWANGQMFDSQLTDITFGNGAKFSNIGPDSSSRAYASNGGGCALGCAPAIGALSWRGNQGNWSIFDFEENPVDYLGFYIFDTDHGNTVVNYHVDFTDGTSASVRGKRAGQSKSLFVGFVNTNPDAQIEKISIDPYATSRFGIDEIEWGGTSIVPEPISAALFLAGGAIFGVRRFVKLKSS